MTEQTIQQVSLAFVSLMQVISVILSSRNHSKLTEIQNGKSKPLPADKAQGELPLK